MHFDKNIWSHLVSVYILWWY